MAGTAISKQVVETGVGDETVLLHLETGTYFGLDSIGTFIWDKLKSGLSQEAIVETLVDTYDVSPDEARADLDAFLAELGSHQIIEADAVRAG